MADDIIPPEDMSNFDKIIQSIRTVRDTIGAGIQRGVDNASTGIRRAWDTLTVPGYGQDPDSAAADLQRQSKFQGSVFNQEYLKELKADPEFQKRQLDRATNIVLNTGAPGAMGLTTKTLERLPQKPVINTDTVRQQMARPDVSKAEKDILNLHLGDEPTINRADFEDKVGGDLLPLKVQKSDTYADYGLENIGVEFAGNPTPSELGAQTHIWKMPESEAHDFKHHFNGETGTMSGQQTYFAHTRRLDEGSTRNITEIQSDLFQRSRLSEQEKSQLQAWNSNYRYLKSQADEILSGSGEEISRSKVLSLLGDMRQLDSSIPRTKSNMSDVDLIQLLNKSSNKLDLRNTEISKKLQKGAPTPGRAAALEKTWMPRTIREENRLAAQEGIQVMRVPVGDTAEKIEYWRRYDHYPDMPELANKEVGSINLGTGERDVRTTGRTRMVQDGEWEDLEAELKMPDGKTHWANVEDLPGDLPEMFMESGIRDVMESQMRIGKLEEEHQGLYDFYDKDVRKFVAKEYGAKEVTDKNGHKWMEWKVDPKAKDRPVQALTAGAPGTDVSDDKDKIDLTPIDKHIEFLRKLRNGGSARSR